MILELKLLGFRLEIDPKTVEALLGFVTFLIDRRDRDEKSASSTTRACWQLTQSSKNDTCRDKDECRVSA